MNHGGQYYKGIPLNLINRSYKNSKAKRFTINGTNQNVWIPNKHLTGNGDIVAGEDLDYIFKKSRRQCEIAGIGDGVIDGWACDVDLNYGHQCHNGIPLKIVKGNYQNMDAKQFIVLGANVILWIPNKHLDVDGTVKESEKIQYIFNDVLDRLEKEGAIRKLVEFRRIIKEGAEFMAIRPIFLCNTEKPYYKEQNMSFKYCSGFSVEQRRECIDNFHSSSYKEIPGIKILEVSSRSKESLGVKLSAFNLMINTKMRTNAFSVESAFQSSKVFERGGPFVDILSKSSKDAKTDPRLKSSGTLIGFDYFGKVFPLTPMTYFYDWLYINTLNLHPYLCDEIMEYTAFTDIEFNPAKSINCQARSAAIYVSLRNSGKLAAALENPKSFLGVVYKNKD